LTIKLYRMKTGRVVLEYNKFYNVLVGETVYQCQLSGKFKNEAISQSELPKVGDWVSLDLSDSNISRITDITPRKNEFLRKVKGQSLEKDIIATNIDVAFIVMGLDKDFNLSRLERYIVLAEGFLIKPVLLFNKLDLCKSLTERKKELDTLLVHYDYFFSSCKNNEGVSEIQSYMEPEKTYVVLGASGVGKSSLINLFLGDEKNKIQKVGAVREKDSRGMHTTRHRELIVLPSKAIIIDTPGIREVQLWETEEGLRFAFSDLQIFSKNCKFKNCTHSHEISCSVKEAVESGKYPRRRYNHYCKLLEEVSALEKKKKNNSKYLKQTKYKRKK
jgi:ribosome biogenesis GTPase / thiamine phosphate phosphatase